MEPVNPFSRFAVFCGSTQMVRHVNPLDHQNFAIFFNFAGYFRREIPLARLNFTRLQRATKGPGQSTTR